MGLQLRASAPSEKRSSEKTWIEEREKEKEREKRGRCRRRQFSLSLFLSLAVAAVFFLLQSPYFPSVFSHTRERESARLGTRTLTRARWKEETEEEREANATLSLSFPSSFFFFYKIVHSPSLTLEKRGRKKNEFFWLLSFVKTISFFFLFFENGIARFSFEKKKTLSRACAALVPIELLRFLLPCSGRH